MMSVSIIVAFALPLAGICLLAYLYGGCIVNKLMKYDYMKQGDNVHIYLNGEYNRDATISKVDRYHIYIYGKLPLPLSYRGKFYAMGKDNIDGSHFIYVKKRFYIIPCRMVERFRKAIGLDQYLGNLPETPENSDEQTEAEKEEEDEVR